MPDDTRFNNGPIFVGLFSDVYRLSHWCDADSNNIFENSRSPPTGTLDGHDNRFGMFQSNPGTSVRWICIYEAWNLCDIWFYYCDDGCGTGMAVDL